MTLARWRTRTLALVALSLSLLLLAACTGNAQSSLPPTPTLPPGQQLLAKTNNTLNSAKTLQGVLSLTIQGQSQNGTLDTSVWNAAPAKNRTEVHHSTLSQLPA